MHTDVRTFPRSERIVEIGQSIQVPHSRGKCTVWCLSGVVADYVYCADYNRHNHREDHHVLSRVLAFIVSQQSENKVAHVAPPGEKALFAGGDRKGSGELAGAHPMAQDSDLGTEPCQDEAETLLINFGR